MLVGKELQHYLTEWAGPALCLYESNCSITLGSGHACRKGTAALPYRVGRPCTMLVGK